MKCCVFPGSFDPPTRGHLDLIRRADAMYDRVTVAVMVNVSKQGMIPWEERVRMLKKTCGDIPNVRVELWKGLLADYIRTGLVERFPTLIVCCFVMLAAVVSVFSGLILHTALHKNRQDFELELIRTRYLFLTLTGRKE